MKTKLITINGWHMHLDPSLGSLLLLSSTFFTFVVIVSLRHYWFFFFYNFLISLHISLYFFNNYSVSTEKDMVLATLKIFISRSSLGERHTMVQNRHYLCSQKNTENPLMHEETLQIWLSYQYLHHIIELNSFFWILKSSNFRNTLPIVR